MKLLLDTHALLWFHEGDARLSAAAHALISDTDNDVLVSYSSIWEMALKLSVKKLELDLPLPQFVSESIVASGFGLLPIDLSHLTAVATLPFHHRDPFDRMLAVQCLTEKIPLISRDVILDDYGVRRIW